ncbi:sulfotransferase [Rhodocaloribacter litoris]|uniref:sulfotransferase family protein n=1 Tax=Rhodocaloribacter litoris TaxID=2558931 RepID=UPI0014221A3E|nr:sulfotransferase [Rhodocaloribacter litoris]QXD16193.1 sulfotransferase [Rhodocaloribacter litoris]
MKMDATASLWRGKPDESASRALPVVPDFLIIGAMKSGTTTLHHLLEQHPDVYIPRGELHFFAIDDLDAFPQAQWDGCWVEQDFESFFDVYAAWYARHFALSKPDQIKGEDSATYLSSRLAIDRIARYASEAKLIVLLRDPVARTYSHYWHWVRTGRAIASFEDSIRYGHGNLLQRSYYEEHLRYCLERFSRKQVKILIFEHFIRNQLAVLREVLEFIGVPFIADIKVGQHANPGRYPRFPRLKCLENYCLRRKFGSSYRMQVPRLQASESPALSHRVMEKVFRWINPMTARRPPAMDPATRRWLSGFLRRRNAGLPDLLEIDLAAYWPTFAGDQSTT